ncbi:MAG: C1 family peptidase [Candidatus Sericytochromatia bacterium]|nr:C1 family peptidase [Candidatus Sericytochromatia bacterium]
MAATARTVALPREAERPARVDLRSHCPPVYDQGTLGACTAFAMGKGLREYLQRRNGERQVPLSALWLYYQERVLRGSVGEDSGANMVDGMTVLARQGNATEEAWPYLPRRFKLEPTAEANATADAWKVSDGVELRSFEDVRTALAKGQPVAFGFIVYLRFQFIGPGGKMPLPLPLEPRMGGHAVLAVGYDDEAEHLVVRNSWGARWGDKGYFYMPYKFARDPERAMEWWTACR